MSGMHTMPYGRQHDHIVRLPRLSGAQAGSWICVQGMQGFIAACQVKFVWIQHSMHDAMQLDGFAPMADSHFWIASQQHAGICPKCKLHLQVL